jgi:hypothetical protein
MLELITSSTDTLDEPAPVVIRPTFAASPMAAVKLNRS